MKNAISRRSFLKAVGIMSAAGALPPSMAVFTWSSPLV